MRLALWLVPLTATTLLAAAPAEPEPTTMTSGSKPVVSESAIAGTVASVMTSPGRGGSSLSASPEAPRSS